MFRTISRIIVGIVFMFSGFVKGVDPLGTAYRIEDYFIAYGWEWAMPFALFLSVSLCAVEFILGVSMLFNLRVRLMAWPLALIMIYFTGMTYYDALYEPVPDCGCFGDAVKLTNWQTFYKNIVLIILVAVIFVKRKRFSGIFQAKAESLILMVVAISFVAFSMYQYKHLPMLDFREWKVGADLIPDNPGQAKIYLTYRNIETGEEKEYLSPDYPWNDSAWMATWEFVGQRIDDSEVIKGHDLVIYDLDGNVVTDHFIANPDYQFLVISWNLAEADMEGMKKVSSLYEDLEAAGYSMIIITGSLKEEIDEFTADLAEGLEFFNADDIELKAMIRSNPGLILLKDGMVIDKWHFNDLPDFNDLELDE